MNKRGRVAKQLGTFAVVLLLATAAFAQSRADCSVIKSQILKRNVPYCVILPPSFSTDKARHFPILYYLHGIGDNEQSLINTGGWNTYEDLLRQKKVGEFILAAPAGFQTFFINSRDGQLRYEDFFLGEFMPAIERKYRAGERRSQRALVGISMGGFGALHLGFAHPNLFVSTAGIMPALMEKLPASFGSDTQEQLMKRVFGDASDPSYYRRVSVFTFAEKRPVAELKALKIYFAAGTADDYNFQFGAEALHKLLERRGIPHEFHLDAGRHSPQFAIEHFGPALEFTWKALEGAK